VRDGQLILIAGSLLALGLLASLIAGRLRMPGLVLFLALGMAVGSDTTGWIDFENYELARTVGVIALSLILFEGGLTAGFGLIRPVLSAALSLAVVGTIVTGLVTGLFAAKLFGFSTLEGMLIGAIVASTDGAAVFAVLRHSTLRRRLAATLEGEAGFNDPVAVLLVLGFIEWIQVPDYGLLDMVVLFVRQMGIGAVAGIGAGWLAVQAFRRARLETAGLYPVASLATVALAFGGADALGGSGFLAVYLTGLALGSATLPAKRTVSAFHQGLAWVAQLTMFLTLGLLVFPAQLDDVILEGTALALVLVFVSRPVATLIATAFASYSARERAVVGWAGLRGAVPVVLATFPVIAGVPRSQEFFNIVFFAVLVSTVLQGTTFEPIARRLGLTTSQPALPQPLTEAGTIRRLGAEVLEYPVGEADAIAGRRVRDLGLPREALVNVIVRGDQAIPPRGSTRLQAGDRLHVLLRQETASHMPSLLERWRAGPIGPPARPATRSRGRIPLFTVRPWEESDGDPAYPGEVAGAAVVEHLRTRHDRRGALVALADGRFAITGASLVVGSRDAVATYARKRLRKGAGGDGEKAWLEEVVGALAAE
jgi:potassium/hydrogen antiporter